MKIKESNDLSIKGIKLISLEQKRLRRDPSVNRYESLLTDLGIKEVVGSTSFNNFLEKKPVPCDELTGLPNEQEIRNYVIDGLTNCIRNGQRWAICLSDLDQLKLANVVGRDFGDQYIKWGAIQMINLIRSSGISPQAEIILFRATAAADEYITCFFNFTDEDVKKIKKIIEGLRLETRTEEFTFSTSAAIIFNDDEKITRQVTEARFEAKNNGSATLESVYELYNLVKNNADAITHMQKITKDLGRLRVAELVDQPNNIVANRVAAEFGGSRVSPVLLKKITELASIIAVKEYLARLNPQTREKVLAELRLREEQLDFNDIDGLQRIYEQLFGQETVSYTPFHRYE